MVLFGKCACMRGYVGMYLHARSVCVCPTHVGTQCIQGNSSKIVEFLNISAPPIVEGPNEHTRVAQ